MKTQELKQKAYQLLINKIDIMTFERYLFDLVEKTTIKSDSLLFDFVNINYHSVNYKKDFHNIIKDNYSEEELLSFEIYENCWGIIKEDDTKEVLKLLSLLSDIYYRVNAEVIIVYSFYRLNMYDCFIENEPTYTEEKDIALIAKEIAFKIVEIYNVYKESENWSGFLIESIETENEENSKMYSSIKEGKASEQKGLSSMILDSLKALFRIT